MKMKKLYFIPAALLGLAMAGCSSDDLAVGEGQGPQWDSQGKGYMALSLNLPTQASTGMRAANDDFEDGEPSEYAVKDAAILIFKGSSETNATLQATYNLPIAGSAFEHPEDNQVTSTVQLTQQINQIDADNDQNKLYALVVLNRNGLFSIGDGQTLKYCDGDTYYGANSMSTLNLENLMTKTFANSNLGLNAADTYTGNGILMMNAPLASNGGGENYAGTVSTLVEVTNGIYTTEREAQENPAASIYVERAVAKVSVKAKSATGSLTGDDKPTTEGGTDEDAVADWTIKGWMLNNQNSKSYFAHNYPLTDCPWWSYKNEKTGTYRFIGGKPVGMKTDGVNTAGYRIYWGGDPNYTDKVDGDLLKISSKDFTTGNMHALDEYDYCFENTFTTPHQNHDETTQAVIAVQFNGGKDFWTLNGSTSTVYINQKNIDNIVKDAFYHTQGVKDEITRNLKSGEFDPSTDLTVTYESTAPSGTNNQAGKWTVTKVELTDDGKAKLNDPDCLATTTAAYQEGIAAAQALQIECYDNGLAYYPVNIKHFGDDLTPWDENDAEGNVSYPGTDAEKNWLGRYGVLRNNWYQLDVTAVRNIGYSDVPQDITDPDDPVARYISVKINILSWAVRKQSVEL